MHSVTKQINLAGERNGSQTDHAMWICFSCIKGYIRLWLLQNIGYIPQYCAKYQCSLLHTWETLKLRLFKIETENQSCLTLCNPMDCSTTGFPVLHHLPKFVPTHVKLRWLSPKKRELPDVQAGFRKGRGNRDQIVNICWVIKKAREFQKNIYFCFIDYAKAFDCVDQNKLWKIL